MKFSVRGKKGDIMLETSVLYVNSQEEIGRHDTLTGNKLLFGAIQSITFLTLDVDSY